MAREAVPRVTLARRACAFLIFRFRYRHRFLPVDTHLSVPISLAPTHCHSFFELHTNNTFKNRRSFSSWQPLLGSASVIRCQAGLFAHLNFPTSLRSLQPCCPGSSSSASSWASCPRHKQRFCLLQLFMLTQSQAQPAPSLTEAPMVVPFATAGMARVL